MICRFDLSVAARKIVRADPSLRYTSMLLGRSATNKQQTTPHVGGKTWKAKSSAACQHGTDDRRDAVCLLMTHEYLMTRVHARAGDDLLNPRCERYTG